MLEKKRLSSCFKKPSPTNAALEISSSGPAGEYPAAGALGLYELIIGEEIEGSPVYRQAHSEEIPSRFKLLLYR